jgi:hypothetical protein
LRGTGVWPVRLAALCLRPPNGQSQDDDRDKHQPCRGVDHH